MNTNLSEISIQQATTTHIFGKNPHELYIINYQIEGDTAKSICVSDYEFTLKIIREKLGSDYIPQSEIAGLIQSLKDLGCDVEKSEEFDFVKENLLKEIAVYDKSNDVDSFVYNGISGWLNQSERSSILTTLSNLKKRGMVEYTLWLGTYDITLPIEVFENLIEELDIYASKSFNTTASHKARVEKIEELEELLSYDYKEGYPERLVIS